MYLLPFCPCWCRNTDSGGSSLIDSGGGSSWSDGGSSWSDSGSSWSGGSSSYSSGSGTDSGGAVADCHTSIGLIGFVYNIAKKLMIVKNHSLQMSASKRTTETGKGRPIENNYEAIRRIRNWIQCLMKTASCRKSAGPSIQSAWTEKIWNSIAGT